MCSSIHHEKDPYSGLYAYFGTSRPHFGVARPGESVGGPSGEARAGKGEGNHRCMVPLGAQRRQAVSGLDLILPFTQRVPLEYEGVGIVNKSVKDNAGPTKRL